MDIALAQEYFQTVTALTPPAYDSGPGAEETLLETENNFYLYELQGDDGSTIYRIATTAWNLRLFVDCSSMFEALQTVLTANKFPRD